MIDTTKILPGQEFKNMQELSVALTGQKMPAGNRYVVRVNEMKKYFSWDKVPGSNRIIITDIFPEPVTKPRKKCKKRIATPREYYPQGKYNSMIYANLTTLELNHKYSLSELFEELGMTSCRFTRPKYYLDCVNTTNLSLSTYRYFFNKLPTEAIEALKEQALQETSYKDEWSVLHSSDSQKYTQYILDKLSIYGIKKYTKCYVFTSIKPFNNLPEPSLSEMNALTIEKLYKFSNKFDQVNQKKIQSIINTSILSR